MSGSKKELHKRKRTRGNCVDDDDDDDENENDRETDHHRAKRHKSMADQETKEMVQDTLYKMDKDEECDNKPSKNKTSKARSKLNVNRDDDDGEPRLTLLSREDVKLLCTSFKLHGTPADKRTKEPEPARPPKKKDFRMVPPTLKERKEARAVEQNTLPWHFWRSRSCGASSLKTICGYDGYNHTNVDIFRLDAGQVAEFERELSNYFPLDEGHFWEDDGIRIYAIVMQCRGRSMGLEIHPKYPWCHASPDWLAGTDPKRGPVYYNMYTGKDLKKWLVEAKLMIYCDPVRRKAGFAPHAVKPCHMIQVQSQMDCKPRPLSAAIDIGLPDDQEADIVRHTDYFANHRFNAQSAPIKRTVEAHRKLVATDGDIRNFLHTDSREYKEEKTKMEIDLDPKQTSHVLYQVGRHLVTRVYHNKAFNTLSMSMLKEHVKCVQTNTPPPERYQPLFPPVKMVPLKETIFYVHGRPQPHPIFLRSKTGAVDGQPDKAFTTVVQYATCKLTDEQVAQCLAQDAILKRPENDPDCDWQEYDGMLPGYMTTVVHHYWDHPPVWKTLEQLKNE